MGQQQSEEKPFLKQAIAFIQREGEVSLSDRSKVGCWPVHRWCGVVLRSWDLLCHSLVPACKASLCPSVGWDPWLRPDSICRIIYSLICFPCWRAVKLDSIEHGMRFDTVIPLHLWVITNTPLARLLLLHSFQPVVRTLRSQVSVCPQGLQKCIDDHRCIFWN